MKLRRDVFGVCSEPLAVGRDDVYIAVHPGLDLIAVRENEETWFWHNDEHILAIALGKGTLFACSRSLLTAFRMDGSIRWRHAVRAFSLLCAWVLHVHDPETLIVCGPSLETCAVTAVVASLQPTLQWRRFGIASFGSQVSTSKDELFTMSVQTIHVYTLTDGTELRTFALPWQRPGVQLAPNGMLVVLQANVQEYRPDGSRGAMLTSGGEEPIERLVRRDADIIGITQSLQVVPLLFPEESK